MNVNVRSARPSLLDRRFTADTCIIDQGDGELILSLGDYKLARITGLSFDLASLNQILGRIWNRPPRRVTKRGRRS